MEQDITVVALIDSDGTEIECELLDRIEYMGESYSVLLPTDDDSAEAELLILKEGPKGELAGFDDAYILDAVFELFMKKHNIKPE